MVKALAFDDVLLVPQFSEVETRKLVNLGNNICNNIRLSIPIISSPMDTVTEHDMCDVMDYFGGLGIIHRYASIYDQVGCAVKAKIKSVNVGAAVGSGGDFQERALELEKAGVNVICVDVAHGHSSQTVKAIERLKSSLKETTHIMAGNVATKSGYVCLNNAGADSVRVGVGSGSVCTTRIKTGHGVPLLHSLLDVASYPRLSSDAKIIADGGIRNPGDIVKSLAAGADFVMLGSMLAGTKETPGKLIDTPDGIRKEYRGMASADAQKRWRGDSTHVEGIASTVSYKGSVEDILPGILANIKSGLSYSGATNINEFQQLAVFIEQSHSGLIESRPHLLEL